MPADLLIYGAGCSGREMAWLAGVCRQHGAPYRLVGFIDDDPAVVGRIVANVPVLTLDEAARQYPGAWYFASACAAAAVVPWYVDEKSAYANQSPVDECGIDDAAKA